MKSRSYERDLRMIIDLVHEAGEELRSSYIHGYSLIHKKGERKTIDASDRVNDLIINKLKRFYPKYGIVSEENMKYSLAEYTWYVDSLDGKESFLDSNDQFSINIGLCYQGKPVMGVIYNPLTREKYYGIKEKGAEKNVEGISFSISTLKSKISDEKYDKFLESIVVPYDFPEIIEQKTKHANIISRLDVRRIIRSGSLALGVIKMIEKIRQEILENGIAGTKIKEVPRFAADAFILGIDKPTSLCRLCAPQAIMEFAGGYVGYINGEKVNYNTEESKFKKSDTNPNLKQIKDPIIIAKSEEEFNMLQRLLGEIL